MSLQPLTRAEETEYQETSRHADVLRFLDQLVSRGDPRVQRSSFGVSPEGRDLPLLVLSSRGVRTPADARAVGLPVVLVINGIHAGEVEGKEASMMLVRDILDGKHGALLEHLTLVVVPLFNPDGNDRIDPANRKLDLSKLEGQIGPARGVGTRGNAAGINLNRDYLRQDTLEMRLLSEQVYQVWLPHLTVDCHSTNGSIHRFALTYDTPHTVQSGRPEPVRFMRERFLPLVTQRLKARTGLDTFFYGNFVKDEGGSGPGWMTYTHHPRFGSNYRGLTSRLDLLAETFSYLPFPERVRTTYEFLVEVLTLAGEWGGDIMEVVSESQAPLDRVAIRYRLEAEDTPATILTREPYTLEGAPTEVVVPHLARFVGTEVVDRPWGYAIPAELAPHFAGHGLRLFTLEKDRDVAVEVATVEGAAGEASRAILETSSGEQELRVHFTRQVRRLPTGTVVVPTGHAWGAVAVYLCEARSDDSVVACGWLPVPPPGSEFPVLRVLDALE